MIINDALLWMAGFFYICIPDKVYFKCMGWMLIAFIQTLSFWTLAVVVGDCSMDWSSNEPGCFMACIRERSDRIMYALEYSRHDCVTCFPPPPVPAMHPVAAAIMDGYWH